MSSKYNQSILLVGKDSSIKELKLRGIESRDSLISSLYKKCGFKSNIDFIKQTSWNVKYSNETIIVSVYAKMSGKANYENKYEFPPPIDNKLFFGTCCIIAEKNNLLKSPFDLSVSIWKNIYENLYGGFENINGDDEDDEDDEDLLDLIDSSKKTKNGGYFKDGFVVEDSDGDGDGDDDVDNDSEDSYVVKKPIKKPIKKSVVEDELKSSVKNKKKVVDSKKMGSNKKCNDGDDNDSDDNDSFVNDDFEPSSKKNKNKSSSSSSMNRIQEDNYDDFPEIDNELTEEEYIT